MAPRPARAVDAVVVPLSALAPAPEPPAPHPAPVQVGRVRAQLQAGDEAALSLVAPVHLAEAGWLDLRLPGPALVVDRLTVDGRAAQSTWIGGERHLVAWLPAGAHTVSLRGTLDGAADRVRLTLGDLGGAAVALAVEGDGVAFTPAGGIATAPGAWDLPPRSTLEVAWAPERPPPPRARVVQVDTAAGLRVDEGGVEGRAVLRYRVVHQPLEQLALSLPAAATEVQVKGPGVAGVDRRGDRVVVRFGEPVLGVVELAVSWRAPAPGESSTAAPVVRPLDGRGETWLTVVRGDDSVLLPEPGAGLEPRPARRLPATARGLVPGEPLVAYHAAAGATPALRWRRLTFQPVDQPPTLVDEARYTVVHTDSGRVWMRATWQVRNDRNPFLRVRVPDGWQVFGLRVAGATSEPARAEDGALLVPLEKSVETLDGLVAFPVELMLVGAEEAWSDKGDRALVTPAIDAPIAFAKWEVRLPRGAEARAVTGRASVVDQWTSDAVQVDLGRGVKRSSALAISEDEARSQEYWNQAYSAYKDNRFDAADALLQRSLEENPDNSAAQALQRNVDVFKGRAELDEGDALVANRVRELARAKSAGAERKQEQVESTYRQALERGDLEVAASAGAQLLSITEELAALEQTEAVDQKARLAEVQLEVAELERDRRSGSRRARAEEGKPKAKVAEKRDAAPSFDDAANFAGATVIDFEDVVIEGAVTKPQGALILDRVAGGVAGGVIGGELGGVFGGSVGRSAGNAEAPEEVEEEVAMDGDFDFGLDAGQVALVYDTRAPAPAPASAAAPAPPPPPPVEAPRPEPEPEPVPADETVALESLVVQHDRGDAPDDDDASRGAVLSKDFLQRVPTGRSYQSAVQLAAGVSTGRRADAAPPPPPLRFPRDAPAPAAFPAQAGAPAPFPAGRPATAPERPRSGAPAPAHPLKPAPPPAASWGLAVPDGIDASTLSLSLPETGAGLLLEQRLVPADQPLTIEMRYRIRRRP